MMKKKWRACVFSVMALGGVVIGSMNQPSFAASQEAAQQIIVQKADQERESNGREKKDQTGQVNVQITPQQGAEIAAQQVNGKVVRTKLEQEDGRTVYEVAIQDENDQLHKVTVDAQSGSVIKIKHKGNHRDNEELDHDLRQ